MNDTYQIIPNFYQFIFSYQNMSTDLPASCLICKGLGSHLFHPSNKKKAGQSENEQLFLESSED